MANAQDRLGLFLGFVGVVVFGGTLPATRLATPELGFAFVSVGRAAGAGLLALGVLGLLRRPIPDSRTLGGLALVSLCVVWGFPLFSAYAMTSVSSAHGGVVLAILPLATALAGAWINGERPSARFWGFAIAGAALVLLFAFSKGDGSGYGFGLGDLSLLAATASASIGYAISARIAKNMPGWEVISWAVVISLPATIPAALMTAPLSFSGVSGPSWWAFVYITVMSQYVGFFAWNAGLKLGGVARVSQVQLLQSFVTLAVAALILAEPVEPTTILFAIAVVAVVALGRQAPVRPA